MKVCLIGQNHGPWDEGMKIINLHLFKELGKRVNLLIVDPEECKTSLRGWKKIKAFGPDIIHYLHGPTIRSMMLCRLLRWAFPAARIVLSAVNPWLHEIWDVLLPYLSPHLVLAVTSGFQQRMTRRGILCKIIYPGVDQRKFHPVNLKSKKYLRQSLGFPLDKKVVLQVGHFTAARGVLVLGELQQAFSGKVQFVVVGGSDTIHAQASIVKKLKSQGVRVEMDFVPRIEKFYQAADVFLFTGMLQDAAIDIPLSILEAMAVNLPIITTPFGGLPEIFSSAPWFRYTSSIEEMINALEAILHEDAEKPQTKNMVTPYKWSDCATKILSAYENINGSTKRQ